MDASATEPTRASVHRSIVPSSAVGIVWASICLQGIIGLIAVAEMVAVTKREDFQPMHGNAKNYLGFKFGSLRVVGNRSSIYYSGKARPQVLAKCVCGREKIYLAQSLGKLNKSCGCEQKQRIRASKVASGNWHLQKHTSEYGIWCALRSRCNNLKNHAYKDYGGRGIFVCKRWDDFRNFLSDMGRRPSITHSIDRINNDGGYNPENCRWATKSQQAQNRRKKAA